MDLDDDEDGMQVVENKPAGTGGGGEEEIPDLDDMSDDDNMFSQPAGVQPEESKGGEV